MEEIIKNIEEGIKNGVKKAEESRNHNIEEYAKVIGYHFWEVKTDQAAINCGWDCAKDLEKEGLI